MLEVIIQVRWKNMTLLYSQSIIYKYIYIYINFPIYGSILTTIGECEAYQQQLVNVHSFNFFLGKVNNSYLL